MNIPIPDSGIPVKPGDDHFIYKDVYHPITWVGDKPYRPRVETLIVKNSNMVYLRIKTDKLGPSGNKDTYELPGGSTDKDSDLITQAENEVNEEALMCTKNMYNSGIQYYEDYPEGFLMGGGDTPLEYNGHISTVFVAEYSGIHDKRSVEKKDLDPKIADNGKFYNIIQVAPILKSQHIDALLHCPFVSSQIKGSLRILCRMNSKKTPSLDNIKKDEIVGELLIASKLPKLTKVFPNKVSQNCNGNTSCNKVKVFQSVNTALMGYDTTLMGNSVTGGYLKGGDLVYIYKVVDCGLPIYTPSNEESASSKLTGELWIKTDKPVNVKRLGMVKVISDGTLHRYYFGKNSMFTGEILELTHEWVIKDTLNTPVIENTIVLPKNTLYHGSTYEITEFRPMSLDLGNAHEEPGWSTFTFDDYNLALRFGLMRAIQKAKDNYGDQYKDVVCAWDLVKQKPWISKEDFRRIESIVQGFKFYVYTIDATNLDVGVGNDERLPEYTFRESGVIPKQTDIIRIDNTLLSQHLIICNESSKKKIKEQESLGSNHNRGWYSTLMVRDYNNGSASAELQKAINKGELKPGDDIRGYMNSHGLSFEGDSVSIMESKNTLPMNMYFLSETNMNNKILTPRIPNNFMTKNGYEDTTTKRVCFAPSINKALMGISQNMTGKRLFVHQPIQNIDKLGILRPTKTQVPDVGITGEIWATKPVTLQCIGSIIVDGDKGLPGHTYSYGDNTAELYDWDWYWDVKNIEEPVTESLLISKGVFDVNFEDFENGKSNVVLITGLSGSGKTTLAEKIANKYSAEYIELDMFEKCYFFETDDQLKECGEVFYEYLSHHKDIWEKLKSKSIHGKELGQEIDKFVKYAISWCKQDRDHKYVIEGVQIYSFLDKEKISNTPILFIGTSAFKSLVRRLSRTKQYSKDDFKKELSELPQCIRWYIEENKSFEKFKKSVLECTEIDCNEYVTEGVLPPTRMKSVLDDHFKKGKQMKLSSFKKVPISKASIKKYGSLKQSVAHLDPRDSGYIFIDSDDDFVAFVAVDDRKEDSGDLANYNWITEIEVAPKYRGCGLSKQLLDIATGELKGDFLTVSYDNEVAINLYKKYGFKIGKNSYDQIKSGKSESKMYTMFYKNRHPKDMEFVNECAQIKSSNYYRIEYEGDGIYNAVKSNVDKSTWSKLLQSNGIKWLPKPPSYAENNKSYFTQTGYDTFIKRTLPLLKPYIDSNKLHISSFNTIDTDIVYSDRYQVVTEETYVLESTSRISYSKSKNHIIDIIESLPMSEKKYIGNHVDEGFAKQFVSHTKNLKYRDVLLLDNTPVAFLDVYTMPEMSKNEGTIVLAVRAGSKYRHHGYGTILVNRMQKHVTKQTGITKLIWEYDNDNIKSRDMAKLLGFKGNGTKLSKTLESFVMESAVYSTTNKYPVFIILMHTGAFLASVIKTATGDDFSHAAISFNSTLNPFYSFGTKKLGGKDRGFTHQSTKNPFYEKFKTRYHVYVMYVDKEQLKNMHNRITHFMKNEETLKYDVASLLACAMKVPTEFRNKYFCSRFVMDILGAGIDLPKAPSLWTPQQISTLDNVSLVNSGDDFYNYDYTITEKNLQLIQEGRESEIVLEQSTEQIPRKDLPDEEFGLPEHRKYPLDTPEHVLSAIKFFNYVDLLNEEQLATNIKKKMKEFNMDTPSITTKNRFAKYVLEFNFPFNKNGRPADWSIVNTLPKDERRKVLELSTIYLSQPVVYTNSLVINNEVAGVIHLFRDKNDPEFGHVFDIINPKFKPWGTGEELLHEMQLTILDPSYGINYFCVDYANNDGYALSFSVPPVPDEPRPVEARFSNAYVCAETTSVSKQDSVDILYKILSFNEELNQMEYILPNKGNVIIKITENDYEKYYYGLTPKEFLKYNGGVCWDYVVYEAQYFKNVFRNVKYETFWIELHDVDGDRPTHTILLFYIGGKVYWFESSWKRVRGVYAFNTKHDALNCIVSEMIKQQELNGNHITGSTIKVYNALDRKLIGMTCDEYYTYMDKLPEYSIGSTNRNIPLPNNLQSPQPLPTTEEKNIFESGDFVEYVKHADLDSARGPVVIDLNELRKANPITETWIPVLEADDPEDEPTDYTNDIDDGTSGGDSDTSDEPTDYTENVQEEDSNNSDDQDDITDNNEENTDTSEDNEDTDSGEEEPTDYTENDNSVDGNTTEDDLSSDTTDTEEEQKSGSLFDNNVLKNYSLLKNLEKLYELTKEVSDSLDSTVMPTKLQNEVLAQVLKNLGSIKEFILSYVKFQFSLDNYSQNLYYYNIVLQALSLNLKLLKRNRELEDSKQ